MVVGWNAMVVGKAMETGEVNEVLDLVVEVAVEQVKEGVEKEAMAKRVVAMVASDATAS